MWDRCSGWGGHWKLWTNIMLKCETSSQAGQAQMFLITHWPALGLFVFVPQKLIQPFWGKLRHYVALKYCSLVIFVTLTYLQGLKGKCHYFYFPFGLETQMKLHIVLFVEFSKRLDKFRLVDENDWMTERKAVSRVWRLESELGPVSNH